VTVVSGYWPVPNKYPPGSYNRWLNNSMRLNAPYVFHYGGAADLEWLQGCRAGLQTEWRLTSLDDLGREFAAVSGSRGPKSAEAHQSKTWELHVIWYMKLRLLELAAAENPFGTHWFAWVDAGIVRYRNQLPPAAPWPRAEQLARVPPGSMLYAAVTARWHCFAGTAFLLHKSKLKLLSSLYYKGYRQLCARDHAWNDTSGCINKAAGISAYYHPTADELKPSNHRCQHACADDQTMFAYVREAHPELFYSVTNLMDADDKWLPPKETKPGRCVQPCVWSCVVDHLY